MASGSFAVGSTNGYITAVCNWSSTPNTAGNYSDVYVELRASRTNNYTTYGSGTTSIVIDGEQFNIGVGSSQRISLNSNTFLGSASKRVYHNADGSKQCGISAYMYISAPLTLGTTSSSPWLDNIPRTSQVTLSDSSRIMRDQTVTIYTNRKTTAFTHDVWYAFGTISWVKIATGITDTFTWTPPIALASQIPNATSGAGTILLRTYNGATTIGDTSATITLMVPSDIIPTVSAIVSDPTGYANTFSGYVVGKSKYKVDLTDAGVYGSTIASRSITMNGTTYNAISTTSDIIAIASNNTVVIQVTDSRGRTSTVLTKTQTVLDYASASISVFSVSRCNSNGTLSDEGEYSKVSYTAVITALNNVNTKALLLRYKKVADANFTEQSITLSTYTQNGSVIVATSGLYSYNFELIVTDYFGSFTSSALVSTAFTIVDYSAGGRGMAIGKVAEYENILDCALPLKVQNRTLLDWIHPIGDIIFSADSTFNPATYYGGTWLQIIDRMIIGAGGLYTNGATGGESTHLLTTPEIPSHNHTNIGWASSINVGANSGFLYYGQQGTSGDRYTGYTGGGTAHNNMPPYIAKYVWQRTA